MALSPFRQSIRKKQELHFFKVTLSFSEVSDLVAELCSPDCQISTLKLYKNNFDPKTLARIVEALKINRSVQNLQLVDFKIMRDLLK